MPGRDAARQGLTIRWCVVPALGCRRRIEDRFQRFEDEGEYLRRASCEQQIYNILNLLNKFINFFLDIGKYIVLYYKLVDYIAFQTV